MNDKCIHINADGICEKLSDDEVRQPCVEGPCEYDTCGQDKRTLCCPLCGRQPDFGYNPKERKYFIRCKDHPHLGVESNSCEFTIDSWNAVIRIVVDRLEKREEGENV